jgi:hypothetical protein
MHGEGLHQDFGFNNHLYPGSTLEGEWAFSYPKVNPATRVTVAANGDVLGAARNQAREESAEFAM